MAEKTYEAIIELEYATEYAPDKKKNETIRECGNYSAYEVKIFALKTATKKLVDDGAIGDIYINIRLERNGEYFDSDEDFVKLVNGQLVFE